MRDGFVWWCASVCEWVDDRVAVAWCWFVYLFPTNSFLIFFFFFRFVWFSSCHSLHFAYQIGLWQYIYIQNGAMWFVVYRRRRRCLCVSVVVCIIFLKANVSWMKTGAGKIGNEIDCCFSLTRTHNTVLLLWQCPIRHITNCHDRCDTIITNERARARVRVVWDVWVRPAASLRLSVCLSDLISQRKRRWDGVYTIRGRDSATHQLCIVLV